MEIPTKEYKIRKYLINFQNIKAQTVNFGKPKRVVFVELNKLYIYNLCFNYIIKFQNPHHQQHPLAFFLSFFSLIFSEL